MPLSTDAAEPSNPITSSILSCDALSTLNKGQLIEAYLKTADLVQTIDDMKIGIKKCRQ